ncbi:sensor histidine kinase [Maribacter halichondriae]|uniref:sensor histidine kinase n=1 Tax=Maribacter halichondriae TaxID=2980554 RepID=UPI0023594144|nr:histidine kinase [Maribacter sp. Hal144]
MNGFKFNKSDYRFILVYFIGASIWLLYRWNIEEYSFFEIITGLSGFIIKNLLLLFIFRWLINKYLVVRKNYVVFILLAFIAWEAVGFLDMWRDYYTANHPWELPSVGVMLVQNFYRAATDSVMLIGLILGKKYYENKLDYVKLQSAQKELELKILRSQYDPHFLYNSLNTIDALVDYSPKEKVKQYIAHLAALYRHLIHTKDEDIVTLKDELDLAGNYFYLIETRFENDYSFEIVNNVAPKLNYLPNGAILTVLENVVKHNKALDGKTIETRIIIEEKAVLVTNTKATGRTKNESLGTGLQNLSKRYQLLSDQTIKVEETENTFTIRLPLLRVLD